MKQRQEKGKEKPQEDHGSRHTGVQEGHIPFSAKANREAKTFLANHKVLTSVPSLKSVSVKTSMSGKDWVILVWI